MFVKEWRICATRMNWLIIIFKVQFCYELGIVDPLADFNGSRLCCFMRVLHSHLKSCLYTQEEVWTDNKHAISFILHAIIPPVAMHWEKYSALSQDRDPTRKQNLTVSSFKMAEQWPNIWCDHQSAIPPAKIFNYNVTPVYFFLYLKKIVLFKQT